MSRPGWPRRPSPVVFPPAFSIFLGEEAVKAAATTKKMDWRMLTCVFL